MVGIPCEGEAAQGGKPHGWGESDLSPGCEWERPLEQRDEQLVLPMRSLDDGIFMHPNQDSITFCSRIIVIITNNN